MVALPEYQLPYIVFIYQSYMPMHWCYSSASTMYVKYEYNTRTVYIIWRTVYGDTQHTHSSQ